MITKILHCILFLSVLFFSACMQHPKYDPKKDYSFKASDTDTTFSNPQKGKTRLYFYRESAFQGSLIRYNISTHHGKFNVNKPFLKDYEFAFFSTPGFAYYVDIDAKDSITLYAKTESPHTFSFTPKEDFIYCFMTGVNMGFFVGRPYFVLVDMPTCKKQVAKLIKKDSKQYWERYKKDFIKKRAKSK